MNYSYIKHELLLMIKSKKNLMCILFLLALIGTYCFVLLPNKKTVDSFDAEQMKLTLVEMKDLQENRERKGATGVIKMVGMSVYAADEHTYKMKSAMLHAYEKEEFTRFLRLKYLNTNQIEFRQDQTLFAKSPFPVKDRDHLYAQTIHRYESYLVGDFPIPEEVIEQKTALQTLQNLLVGPVLYLLVFCAIYFSSDVLVRDRRNRTVLQGMPIGWYRLINLKTLAALSYSSLVLGLLVVVGIGLLTFQNGFGSINLQMPIAVEGEAFGFIDYDSMAIGKFILLTMVGGVLLVYLFTRLNMVFSLVFKNEWLVLLMSTFVLFSERLYFARDLREIAGIEISYFPQTYFEIGKVLSGDKNFLVNLVTISYGKGIVLFICVLVLLEVLLWLLSKVITRQRFYATN